MRVYRHSRELRMLKIHYVELLLLYVYLLRFFASLRLLVRAMLVLSNGLSLVTGNSDGTLKLWSVASKKSIGMFDNYHTGCVRKIIQLSEDLIASCSDDAHIKIWNVNHLELTDVLKGEDTKIYDILLLDEGRLLSAGEDCAINVWSIDKKG